MPRVSFPVGWSSLRTTETSAPRATSLRFRPSISTLNFAATAFWMASIVADQLSWRIKCFLSTCCAMDRSIGTPFVEECAISLTKTPSSRAQLVRIPTRKRTAL